jgi:hypothetical protein
MPALFAYAPPLVWASGCAALAVLYFIVWPRRRAAGLKSGLRYFALRWFHSLVWVLLGISLGLHAVQDDGGTARLVAKLLAILALGVYAAFLAATYAPRR